MYLRQARPPVFINTLNDSRDDMGFEQDINTEILIADAIETCVDVNRTVSIEILDMCVCCDGKHSNSPTCKQNGDREIVCTSIC